MSDNIALQTKTYIQPQGGPGALGGMGDAIQNVDRLAQVQQRGLSAQGTMQEFAAKQRAGAIIAAAPDFETGLKQAQSDPLVAGFAPMVLGQLRQTQGLITSTQGEQAKQNRDGIQSVLQAAAGAARDPSRLPALITGGLQGLPQDIQDRIKPAIGSFTSALLDGLPADPTARGAAYTQRLVGLLSSAGMSPDTVAMNVGKTQQYDFGDRKQFGLELPGQVPQALGGPMGMGMAPSFQTIQGPDGAPRPMIAASGPGGLGASLTPMGAAPAAGAPLGAPSAPPGAPAPSAPAAPPPAASGEAPRSPIPSVPAGMVGPAGIQIPSAAQIAGMPAADREAATTEAAAKTKLAHAIQEKYLMDSGTNAAELEKSYAADAAGIPQAALVVNHMQDMMEKFQTGGLMGNRLAVAQFGQGLKNIGLDISQGALDKLAGGSLSDAEFFKANIAPQMIHVLKESAQGTGRVMKDEVSTIMQSIDLNTDPKTIMMYLNQAKTAMQIGMDRANGFSDYAQRVEAKDPTLKGKTLAQYPIWYSQNTKFDQLPTKTPGGLELGPRDPARAIGAGAAPAATDYSQYDKYKGKTFQGLTFRGGDYHNPANWSK
jgi:hypothetical protein